MSDNCSELQEKGKNHLETRIPYDEIYCKPDSEDILIVRTEKGWSQETHNTVSEKEMFEIIDEDPIGNPDVRVRVLETEEVDIDKKKEEGYRM